jgi:hypothetical protein
MAAPLGRRALLFAPSLLRAAPPDLLQFFRAFSRDFGEARAALAALEPAWRDSYSVMLLELARIYLHGRPDPEGQSAATRVLEFLAARTGKNFGADMHAWNRWMWTLPYEPHPDYATFKALAYSNIDPRMREFFPKDAKAAIRLDQVQWGGVSVNGIPPLVKPKTVPAADAAYLAGSHVVFGIEVEGEPRAYPKRILAWHEMALDTLGGVDLAIAYCTLCGTVIPWKAHAGGRRFTFGTSGFLYESSKLMFDAETKSLWATLQGKPVVGPLAGSPIALDFVPVVTTTWDEWREMHPRTTVLSLDTGHQRDYSEGAAYRDYFATSALMFEVSRHDRRLRNKDEILAIRPPGKAPLAIAVSYLRKKREFTVEHEGVALTVSTSKSGASVVRAGGERVPAHRAFWFGWQAQFPGARLIR